MVKSFLVGGANSFRQQDMALSDKCVEILKLCATKDRIAQAFYLRLSKYQSILKEHLPMAAADDISSGAFNDNSYDGSYLFGQTSGTTKLDQQMHELWEMLCYPLNLLKGSTETRMHYPTIVEASVNADINFARHLASSFSTAENDGPVGMFPLPDSPWGSDEQEKEVEGYISRSVPYDWEASPGTKCAGVTVD